jgi:hypothetical protein
MCHRLWQKHQVNSRDLRLPFANLFANCGVQSRDSAYQVLAKSLISQSISRPEPLWTGLKIPGPEASQCFSETADECNVKRFWIIIGWTALGISTLFCLFVLFSIEQGLMEWARPLMPFLRWLRESFQWVAVLYFGFKILDQLANLWDKLQKTLEATLITSQEATEHLRLLREEIEDRSNQQRSFTW